MKNSSKLLVLSLVLFLGACAVTETPKTPEEIAKEKQTFLAKVSDKGLFRGTILRASFNVGGEFDYNYDLQKYALVSVTDKDTGVYKNGDGFGITITTADGITGKKTGSYDTYEFVLKTSEDAFLFIIAGKY